MYFKFNFGNKPKTIFRWAIVTIVVSGTVGLFSQCTKIPEEKLWNAIIDYNRIFKGKLFPQDLKDYINNDPSLLKIKIEREVTSAINDYEKWELKNRKINMKNPTILREIKKSKYSDNQRIIIENAIYYELPPDGSYAQSLLGGEMGIRGAWVSK
jgi:hypothetical protein